MFFKYFMENVLGFISGFGLTALGIFLLIASIRGISVSEGLIPTLIFGVVSLCVGVYMLFNLNKEDEIEQVKEG